MLARRFLKIDMSAEVVFELEQWPYSLMTYTHFHDMSSESRVIQHSDDAYTVIFEWEEIPRPNLPDEVCYRVSRATLTLANLRRLMKLDTFVFCTASKDARHICVIRDANRLREDIKRMKKWGVA
tara:strand:+ start:336 stop:710 length:375 start_codon:yes stop_codon:yes gene_type:complete